MKMDTKKRAATFAVLMLALGIAGYAYAHWSDTLWLKGTVTTGKFGLQWTFDATLPSENTKPVYGPVANLTWKFVDDANGIHKGIMIALDNVYPCLNVTGHIDVKNIGTIPASPKLDECTFTVDPKNATDWVDIYKAEEFGNLMQIDPGEDAGYNFIIHFNEATPQGATATVDIYLVFWNWNEITP